MTTLTNVHVQMRALPDARPGADPGGDDILQADLDRRDEELVLLIEERVALARMIGDLRQAGGGCRFGHRLELATVARFLRLGPLGTEMALLLVRLSRTKALRSDGPRTSM
jgi:hypothetical protein